MRKVREKSGKSQGIETGCLNLNVLPFLRFNLMISVSTKLPYQVVEKSGHPL